MNTNLNQVEKDFVEFISTKRDRPYNEVEKIFLQLKNRFKFKGKPYQKLSSYIRGFFKIMYDGKDECSLIEANQFYALLHTYNYISYTYPKSLFENISDSFDFVKKGKFGPLFFYTKRKISGKFKSSNSSGASFYTKIAKELVGRIEATPVVVDYGCGLAYISFEIAKMVKGAHVILVDIDCIHLEFTEFRFKKYDLDFEVIKIDKNNLYPRLPKHNICIATEVMEHVYQPLTVYQNILDSLECNGVLYGNYEDHEGGVFHVSPKLNELRDKISQNFTRLNMLTYKKK